MLGFCTALLLPVSLWLSSTIINSRIFSLQAVHLQIHLLSAVVSGDGKPALDWLRVVDAATATADISDPLQSFSSSLSDPSIVRIATEPRICAGQSVGFSRPFNRWFRLSQCLTLSTCRHSNSSLVTVMQPYCLCTRRLVIKTVIVLTCPVNWQDEKNNQIIRSDHC